MNFIFPVITENDMNLPYYVSGVGYLRNQEHITRPSGYPYYQWIQCRNGKGELITEGKVHTVVEGQGMLLYPDRPHEYYALTETWVVDWILFGGTQVSSFFENTAKINGSVVYFVSQPEIIHSRIRSVLEILESDRPMKSLECSSLAYEIFIDIIKYGSIKYENSMDRHYGRLKPLFDFIDKNYSRNLSLEDLSAIIGITPQHLCVLFKKVTSMRVFEYINFVRIKKSKELILSCRNMQIKEIAGLAGYSDVSYFCSQFRKLEQISPNEFKKLHLM